MELSACTSGGFVCGTREDDGITVLDGVIAEHASCIWDSVLSRTRSKEMFHRRFTVQFKGMVTKFRFRDRPLHTI